jgi:hypothetical protein
VKVEMKPSRAGGCAGTSSLIFSSRIAGEGSVWESGTVFVLDELSKF